VCHSSKKVTTKQPSQKNFVKDGMIRDIKKKATVVILVFAVLFGASCQKDTAVPVVKVERTIRFVLYTDKDFSNENGNITFSTFIREDKSSRHIFDSTFSVMKVKDIPSQNNKIVFEKKIFVDAQQKLSAGFIYYLENVGISWHIEAAEPGELFKEIKYPFQ
jgi:hypothetical protein